MEPSSDAFEQHDPSWLDELDEIEEREGTIQWAALVEQGSSDLGREESADGVAVDAAGGGAPQMEEVGQLQGDSADVVGGGATQVDEAGQAQGGSADVVGGGAPHAEELAQPQGGTSATMPPHADVDTPACAVDVAGGGAPQVRKVKQPRGGTSATKPPHADADPPTHAGRGQAAREEPTVEVSVVDRKRNGVPVRVPPAATIGDLKRALLDKVGRGDWDAVWLARRVKNTYTKFEDLQYVAGLREVIVMGLDLGRGTAPQPPEEWYAKVPVTVTLAESCENIVVRVRENALMGDVRAAIGKQLKRPGLMEGARLATSESCGGDEGFVDVQDGEQLKGRWWLWLFGITEGDFGAAADELGTSMDPDSSPAGASGAVPPDRAVRDGHHEAEDDGADGGNIAASLAEDVGDRINEIAAWGGANLIGRWCWRNPDNVNQNFEVTRAEFGYLRIVTAGPAGSTLFGTLLPEGEWFQGELRCSDGTSSGSYRMRSTGDGNVAWQWMPASSSAWGAEVPSVQVVDAGGRSEEVVAPALGAAGNSALALHSHWIATAEGFVDMLVGMRADEADGGRVWMEGIEKLISYPSKNNFPFTAGDDLGFDEFAAALLHDVHMALSTEVIKNTGLERLNELLTRLESHVAYATRHLQPAYDWTTWPGFFGDISLKAARTAGACLDPPFGGFGEGKRYLLFVGLPVALYVSDCPHLYQLVRRMRSLATHPPPMTPSRVRAILDRDDHPYSVLAYALVAAMQALNVARLPGCDGAEGLEALAPKGGALIFRGLWVPSAINEHFASHSWSFNSFSRSMDGVLSVLNFYSCSFGSEAAMLASEAAHVLVLVMRLRHLGGEWAFPVQLFAGGEWAFPANIEQETVLPPFIRYIFEEDLGVSSSQPEEERVSRLQRLQSRWGIRLEDEMPVLLGLLEGKPVALKGFQRLDRKLTVTARFVRAVEPAPAVRNLFRVADWLSFPKVKEKMGAKETDWNAAVQSVESRKFVRSTWPGGSTPPFELCIVGTWNDFSPERMLWRQGAFIYPVVVGAAGRECFQLLKGGKWEAAVFPSKADASTWQKKAWKVCGPGRGGHGLNWQIGRRGVERAVPAQRFVVMAMADESGERIERVAWRPF